VTRARKILHNVGANVLGIVLNKVDMRHASYYGEYGRYGYYYYRSDEHGSSVNREVLNSAAEG